MRDLVAAIATVIEALKEGSEYFEKRGERLLFPLPVGVQAKVEYTTDITLPDEITTILGSEAPLHWRKLIVDIVPITRGREEIASMLQLQGGGNRLFHSWENHLIAIIMLHRLLRRQGIDFLADLRRRLERETECLLRLCAKLEELKAWLEVMLA